jgi:hypothetical protein
LEQNIVSVANELSVKRHRRIGFSYDWEKGGVFAMISAYTHINDLARATACQRHLEPDVVQG